MIVLKYNPKEHKQIINLCVKALKQGKTVVYPTDTSYGLACDATNVKALAKVYRIKEREKGKPMHIIPPSIAYARRISKWSAKIDRLVRKFWPGPLTLVLPLQSKQRGLLRVSAGTSTIGLRIPDNKIAKDLARFLKAPITTTSANPSAHLSGGFDSYSGLDVVKQFSKQQHKPDILIDAGTLAPRKPSTIVKVVGDKVEVLRLGPISQKQIVKIVNL
jgi:L-threonylcarbamoyladenylate synthase